MKYLITIITFGFLSHLSAMDTSMVTNMVQAQRTNVQLPSAESLLKQLSDKNYASFAHFSDIHNKLGNKTKTTSQIVACVDNELYRYSLEFKNENDRVSARMYKEKILRALLQKNLDAYLILKNCNYVQ